MAAISRRPRMPLSAALALALMLAACSLVKQENTPQDQQEHAQSLIHFSHLITTFNNKKSLSFLMWN